MSDCCTPKGYRQIFSEKNAVGEPKAPPLILAAVEGREFTTRFNQQSLIWQVVALDRTSGGGQ